MKQFSKEQRLVIIVSILASFISFLDGFIVNVALPAIANELGGGLVLQQWTVNAYLLALGSLMLVAGSLSDIFGRIKILYAGLITFGITSLLCAVAPNDIFLIASRALQGAAGALLVPSSLALIMSRFSGEKQARAIGIWTAWSVVAGVMGPLLGGIIVDTSSWRFIFAINVIPILITVWLMRLLRRQNEERTVIKIDRLGAVLGAIGLAGVTFALIEQPNLGWSHPAIYLSLSIGVTILATFIWHEKRATQPMLPLELFRNRNFSAGNIATLFIYGGLSVSSFIITIFLQQVGGYSAFMAGLSFLPITFFMFFLSSYFGTLAGRYGPRVFMTVGPILAGTGFLLMLAVDGTINYWGDLLPGIVMFGLGLSITVAPLTSAILGSISASQSGIGSAINNAAARIAGLIAIATIGLAIGSTTISVESFHRGLIYTAGLLIIGGLISAVGIKNPRHSVPPQEQLR